MRFIATLLLAFIAFNAVAADLNVDGNLTVDGEVFINGHTTRGVTIKPTAENEYAPIKWLDQNDNNVGMIVCHEQQTHGDQHDHCTWYTAMQDRTTRTGRVDLTFGEDFANWTFESTWINFEKDAFIIPVVRSPNGTLWRIRVGDAGHLSTERVN